jgi:hypothetical protein
MIAFGVYRNCSFSLWLLYEFPGATEPDGIRSSLGVLYAILIFDPSWRRKSKETGFSYAQKRVSATTDR